MLASFLLKCQQVLNGNTPFSKEKFRRLAILTSSVYEFEVGCGRLARFFLEEEI